MSSENIQKTKIQELVEIFQNSTGETVESVVIESTNFLMEYLENIGLKEKTVDSWAGHRRRLYNTYNIVSENLADKTVETILDIGTNVVFVPMWRKIRPNAKLVLGIDPDQAEILRKYGENIECYCGDFEIDPIPIADESVDVVSLFEVYEHFYIDPMFVMNEVNRVLKPGGTFFITAPNSCSWRACLASLTLYHPYLYGCYAGPGSRRHVHEPAPRDLHVALNSAGFEAQIFTINNYTPRVPQEFVDFFDSLGAISDLRGDTVVAIGKKIGPVLDRYPPDLYDRGAMGAF